jgi:replicative DNA helicase
MVRTSLEHTKIVLSAVLCTKKPREQRVALLDKLHENLTEAHFPDTQHRNLFLLLEKYLETAGGVLSKAALSDMLAGGGLDAGKQALYLELYDSLSGKEIADDDFRWSIEQLKELAAAKKTAEAITLGMEVLNRGIKDDRGEELFGHKAARFKVLEKFSEIDREIAMQESPEGDMREEADEIWKEFSAPKQNNTIKFGIPAIDNKINGLEPGELDLVVGYTSSGKSQLAATQLAWSAAIEQGKNVVILTTETLRPQVRRRLLSRHSRHPMFHLREGIDSNHLKRGIEFFPKDKLEVYKEIVYDMTKNPTYGKLVIVQVPRNATISTCEGKVNRFQREFNVDLLVIDSINLLKPDRRFSTNREELASSLKEAKQFATTFNDGKGIPIVSPWQTSRDSWKKAQDAGYYTSDALSETAESSASSDVIITILEPIEKQKICDLKAQVVKNRDGEVAHGIDLTVDYSTSYFTSAGGSYGNNRNLSSFLEDDNPELFGI